MAIGTVLLRILASLVQVELIHSVLEIYQALNNTYNPTPIFDIANESGAGIVRL